MDPAGELAELANRLLKLGGGLRERGGCRTVGAVAVPQHGQGERQGRQPLLCSVVQVPLHATALPVTGLHNALPGRPDLLQLGPHLRVQPRVLDRYPRRGCRGAHQALVQRGVVDQRRERPSVALRQGHKALLVPLPRLGQRSLLAASVDPALMALQRVQQLQRRIAKGTGQRCL